MENWRAYVLLIRAALSYAIKNHPYMTVWIVCLLGTEIHGAVADPEEASLLGGILVVFLPLIIKRLFIAAISLDSYERCKISMERARRKELFWKYIKEYIEKKVG